MRTLFEFKQEEKAKLAAEWPHVWERLRMRFYWFTDRCLVQLKTPPIIVTCLTRTPEENTAVGGVSKSLHMANPCRAIDIRRRGFTDGQADDMKKLWEAAGEGWDFVIEGSPHNSKPPHFHLEADWRVT